MTREALSSDARRQRGGLPPGPTFAAVIFDLDGVLLDSNEAWEAVMRDLFSAYGRSRGDLDPEVFLGGDNSRQWAGYLRKALALPLEEDEIVERVVKGVLCQYERHLPLIPGAAEAVARMAARFPLGLASSSPREIIAFVLQRSGLQSLFRAWTSSDDVPSGKPAPDVYLRCCALLGAAPACSVAIEDSRSGILAAKAAGLRVVAVPNPALPLDGDSAALADVVLSSIGELHPGITELLIGNI